MLEILGEMIKAHILESKEEDVDISKGSIKERTLHR